MCVIHFRYCIDMFSSGEENQTFVNGLYCPVAENGSLHASDNVTVPQSYFSVDIKMPNIYNDTDKSEDADNVQFDLKLDHTDATPLTSNDTLSNFTVKIQEINEILAGKSFANMSNDTYYQVEMKMEHLDATPVVVGDSLPQFPVKIQKIDEVLAGKSFANTFKLTYHFWIMVTIAKIWDFLIR